MQPVNNIPGNNPAPLQQDAGAYQPLPGQPLPQLMPVPQHGDAAQLPAMPGQPGQNPNVPAHPALVGGPRNRVQPAQGANTGDGVIHVPRNEGVLNASALALAATAGLQGQALQAARETVFHQFDQVRVEIPLMVEEVNFIHEQNALSTLNLKYLELFAPLDSRTDRGSNGHTYRLTEVALTLKNALHALNASASQRGFQPRLGIDLVASSGGTLSGLLSQSYNYLCTALKSDKLLIYLKVECLRRQEADGVQPFRDVLEALEGHARLQELVLADTWIDDSMADRIRILLAATPGLDVVNLCACTISSTALAALRALRTPRVILPG